MGGKPKEDGKVHVRKWVDNLGRLRSTLSKMSCKPRKMGRVISILKKIVYAPMKMGKYT